MQQNEKVKFDAHGAAIHELGHGLACAHLRIPFKCVQIGEMRTDDGRMAGGRIVPLGCDLLRSDYHRFSRNEIVMILAGGAASELLACRDPGSEKDEEHAREIAIERFRVDEKEVESFLRPLRVRAYRLIGLACVRNAIDELAPVLEKKGEVSAPEIRRVYRQHRAYQICEAQIDAKYGFVPRPGPVEQRVAERLAQLSK